MKQEVGIRGSEFLLLFFVCVIALIIGIIKPQVVVR
ncbi:hypothetical protein IEQ_00736 [Bacillus cereus BAG6X1-2]|nr:hypothetical protein IEQ_00736 [Bacillus cereus BAG6X1-2]